MFSFEQVQQELDQMDAWLTECAETAPMFGITERKQMIVTFAAVLKEMNDDDRYIISLCAMMRRWEDVKNGYGKELGDFERRLDASD
jgi:hypothetical protein